MAEIVYVLTNEAMPGLIKIGKTNGDLAERIRGLFQTGVPLAFDLFFACEVRDAAFAERQLHEAFGDHRLSKNREFFRLAPERARAALYLAMTKEIKLDDQIYPTKEDKADVEAAKRRTRFQFSIIGLQPGTELKLYRDPNITCKTLDDTNQVEFRGERASLSDAATQVLKEMGYQGGFSGPWEWSYEGKRLDEIRREIEEESD